MPLLAPEAAELAAATSCAEPLPRGSPLVGFRRHAPRSIADGAPDAAPAACAPCTASAPPALCAQPRPSAGGRAERSQDALLRLLKESPYVGFRAHAPPSPTLQFTAVAPPLGPLPPLAPEDGAGSDASRGSAAPSQHCLPGELSEDVWRSILSFVVEVSQAPVFSPISTSFNEMLCCPSTWRGTTVLVHPTRVEALAPSLDKWLAAWSQARKIVVPPSRQLQAEVARLAPTLPVEVAWRFDACAKGEGIEVIDAGSAVCRIDDDEVVVVGDAPLVVDDGRPAYIEVRIDDLDDLDDSLYGDGVNEFGIGVTACDPTTLQELGAVAAEVPDSWVVDFTTSMVCLSINNSEETRGQGASADGLRIGDRVGVRVVPEGATVEVFINGRLRDRLPIADERKRVPRGKRLFPVLDLFGRVAQLSRTYAEEPLP